MINPCHSSELHHAWVTQVFWAVPVPIPISGFTHEPAGFPVNTSPRSSKMVKYWVNYEQNNQIDHKPLNILEFKPRFT